MTNPRRKQRGNNKGLTVPLCFRMLSDSMRSPLGTASAGTPAMIQSALVHLDETGIVSAVDHTLTSWDNNGSGGSGYDLDTYGAGNILVVDLN